MKPYKLWNPIPASRVIGKTLTQLQDLVLGLGLPKFTAKQLTDWLYKKDVTSIEEMTNLSKNARSLLSENFEIGLTPYSSVSTSADGTKFQAASNVPRIGFGSRYSS